MANTLRFKRGLASGIPTAAAGEPLFTTDTFDLYIGNGTTNTRFQKYIASGATTQILRGDGSLYTFPLAISSPSTGQVLKYNGTSWVNDSDSGITGSGSVGQVAYFTGATTQAGSNNLFWDNTNVRLGIGNPSPTTNLVVRGNTSGYDKNIIVWERATDGAVQGTLGFGKTSGGASDNNVYVGSITNHPLLFQTNNAEAARIFATGNFGINTGATDSGEKLQVTGTMKVTGASSFGSSITSKSLNLDDTSANGSGRINFLSGGTTFGYIGTSLYTFGESGTDLTIGSVGGIRFGTNNAAPTKMRLDASGNLGLAVTPSAWASLKAFQINSQSSLSADGTSTQLSTNAFFDGAWKYIQTDEATNYYQLNGQHVWRNAISGSANAAITWNQAMTLDASGNLAVGIATASSRVHVDAAAGAAHIRVSEAGTTRGFVGGANGIVTGRNGYFMVRGEAGLVLSGNGNSNDVIINPTTANVQIGGSSDTGEKLQVNGTAKITGNVTVGERLALQPSGFGYNTASYKTLIVGSTGILHATDATTLAFNVDLSANVNGSFTGNGSEYFWRNVGSFRTPNSSNNGFETLFSWNSGGQLTFNNAATFNSSVTAASGIITGNLTVDTNTLFVDASANMVGIGTVNPQVQLDVNGSINLASGFNLTWGGAYGANIPTIASVSGTGSYMAFYPAGSTSGASMRITSGGDVGIGMTPSYKLDVTGSARVSDAIAIGTTPDTNNPFKILKNINATVGIKFENTNTSSSAFSAVQLGTDVSGGTKFTNIVYASSGISASGVYNPDGTSLINNGNGGLNFLGNPIRMYTGGSNGVLRWDIQNDGIRQYNADVPTTNTTDAYRQYSADVTAGNAAPHFRTENGAVIKLYQETTAVGNSTISVGGGNSVLDDTEFDGYTLRQIVKALRNQGILA
jgi:hypothetical protein